MERHAVYCGSREVYEDMEASAKSLLAHTDVDRVWFLIEDVKFPRPLPDVVRCLDVSGQRIFAPDGPNMQSRYTYLAMMRAALAHVLPGVSRVLSLDSDTIVCRDVGELWEMDLGGAYFAAAKEAHRSYAELLYTNTGVALYDLDALRDGKADEAISVLNTRRYTWLEQDVLNYLCQGRIAEMPGDYNACEWTEHADPAIVHYAGRDDWRGEPLAKRWRDASWEDATGLGPRPRVLIAVPTFEGVRTECFEALWTLERPCECDLRFVRGYGAAKARNDIARAAIDGGYTHVLMVDSDVVVAPDALALMLEGDADVVLGCYPRKNTTSGQSELFADTCEDFGDENNINYDALDGMPARVAVKGGGMGCALIRTRAFRMLQFPWFEYVEYPDGNVLSEDLSFCDKCSGTMAIEADTRVRCGHVGARVQWR